MNRKLSSTEPADALPTYDEIVQRNFGVYSAEEQQRIRHGAVAIAGLGCVGGLAASILVRTGVGQLTLIDPDIYEAANFNRQPFADLTTIGLPKVIGAGRCLHKMNPHVALNLQPCRLDRSNVRDLIAGHNVVIQGMDHVPSRVVLHEEAARLGIPVVTMSGQPPFRGMVATFMPDGPPYVEVLSLPAVEDAATNDRVRTERAAHARDRASPGWYEKFVKGETGWGVTAERVYIMATLQTLEATGILAGRCPRARAPKAFVIDLDDPECPVRVAAPPNGRSWDYREF